MAGSSCHRSVNERIVIVNIGNMQAVEVAEVVKTLTQGNPEVVALDFALGDDHDEETALSIRTNLESCQKLVLPTVLRNITLPRFLVMLTAGPELIPEHAATGFVTNPSHDEKVAPNQILTKVEPSHGFGEEYHFAVRTVMLYDSLVAQEFITCHPEKFPINFDRKGTFEVLEYQDVLHSKFNGGEFRGRIVLIGYTGPDNIDKYYTNFKKVNGDSPDMYGIEFHANVIAQILESSSCR